MRPPIIIAAILTVALFLGGCWHVAGQVPGQPANGAGAGTSTTTTTAIDTIDTSDWNTYVNYSYGFSFRYPKEWGYITNSVKNSVTFVGIGKGEKQGRMNVAIQDFAKAPDENTDWGIEFGGEYSKDYLKRLRVEINRNQNSQKINGFMATDVIGYSVPAGMVVRVVRFFVRDNFVLVTFDIDTPGIFETVSSTLSSVQYQVIDTEAMRNKANKLDDGEYDTQMEKDQILLFDTIINTFKQGY